MLKNASKNARIIEPTLTRSLIFVSALNFSAKVSLNVSVLQDTGGSKMVRMDLGQYDLVIGLVVGRELGFTLSTL